MRYSDLLAFIHILPNPLGRHLVPTNPPEILPTLLRLLPAYPFLLPQLGQHLRLILVYPAPLTLLHLHHTPATDSPAPRIIIFLVALLHAPVPIPRKPQQQHAQHQFACQQHEKGAEEEDQHCESDDAVVGRWQIPVRWSAGVGNPERVASQSLADQRVEAFERGGGGWLDGEGGGG